MEEYLHLDAFEIAEKSSFIKWCKGLEADEDWTAWLAQHPSQIDKINQAKNIVQSIKFKEELPLPQQVDQLWSKISDEIDTPATAPLTPFQQRRSIIRRLSYAAAACLVLFFITKVYQSNDVTTTFAEAGESKEVSLPDGSLAILNADSKIEYDASSWDQDRELKMWGEVFFEVKEGKKFTVKTKSGVVSVLGTSFNVFDRAEMLVVQCQTGKVSVKAHAKETILMARQEVSVKEKVHQLSDLSEKDDLRSSWRTGIYYYQDSPLSEVIADLERQLDIKITAEDRYKKKSYTGSFNANNGLLALEEVLWALNLSYTRKGNEIQVIDK